MPVESPVRLQSTPKFTPWEGDQRTIRVIGKGGVDLHADGSNHDITKHYPPGYKGSVASTSEVSARLASPVKIVERRTAGNAKNFAIGSAERSRLLPPTNVVLDVQVGTDAEAAMIRNEIAQTAVKPNLVEYPGRTSHSVVFPTEGNRVILSESPIDQELPVFEEPEKPPEAIYLTTLAGRNWHISYDKIAAYAKREKVVLATSPGTRQYDAFKDNSELGKQQQESLYRTIAASTILFGNKEEIIMLIEGKGIQANMYDSTQLILQAKAVLGVDTISMTDGGEGSFYIDYDTTVYKMPVFTKGKNIDTSEVDYTGAGDTYAANFMKGYMAGETVQHCMRRGAAAAYAVIHEKGVPVGYTQKHDVDGTLLETAHEPGLQANVVYLDQRRQGRPLEVLAEAS